MQDSTAVIVVGAGPTGLMVASELALRGVAVSIVERRLTPSGQSRGGGVNPRTAEVLAMRGLAELATARSIRREVVGGHFAGLPVALDTRPWRTRFPGGLFIPQDRIESILENHLAQLGTTVRRGCQVTALSTSTDEVTITGEGPDGEFSLRGQYLVACDGAHSTIRALTGVPFPGEPGTIAAVTADITLTSRSVTVPGELGHISRLIRVHGGYWMMLHPLHVPEEDNGLYRVVFGGAEQAALPRTTPVTAEEVSRALTAVHGSATRLGEVRWGTRFTDATRQVTDYRHGRILFAGDAAHIHSPIGGQGLNLGVQDAMNLGWKLAAHLHGHAPAGLLDTYHAERHPVAARVLALTKAQRALMSSAPDAHDVLALRDIVTDLARLPDTNRYLAGLMSGLSIRYDLGDQPGSTTGRGLVTAADDHDATTPRPTGRTPRRATIASDSLGPRLSIQLPDQTPGSAHDESEAGTGRGNLKTPQPGPAATQPTSGEHPGLNAPPGHGHHSRVGGQLGEEPAHDRRDDHGSPPGGTGQVARADAATPASTSERMRLSDPTDGALAEARHSPHAPHTGQPARTDSTDADRLPHPNGDPLDADPLDADHFGAARISDHTPTGGAATSQPPQAVAEASRVSSSPRSPHQPQSSQLVSTDPTSLRRLPDRPSGNSLEADNITGQAPLSSVVTPSVVPEGQRVGSIPRTPRGRETGRLAHTDPTDLSRLTEAPVGDRPDPSATGDPALRTDHAAPRPPGAVGEVRHADPSSSAPPESRTEHLIGTDPVPLPDGSGSGVRDAGTIGQAHGVAAPTPRSQRDQPAGGSNAGPGGSPAYVSHEDRAPLAADTYTGARAGTPIQEIDPLVGMRMPDLALSVGGVVTRVSVLLSGGCGLLLDFRDSGDSGPLPVGVERVAARVVASEIGVETGAAAGVDQILVRPDGYVCWVGAGPVVSPRAAVERWFGRVPVSVR
jgi:2-polyprenyl-6-methoxyphenol hydroxylase-like FAD-dependent oxidoreductase